MIDRARAEAVFDEYVSGYDADNILIAHKVTHTKRVAANCECIARSLGMDPEDVDFAWFLGLLHDIGRFEQVKRYGTFIDSQSVDHAEFGADLLFGEGLLRRFPVEHLRKEDPAILETAIRLHNKLAIPSDLDERTACFANIIRDADKADIFRVMAELPFEQRVGSSRKLFVEADEAGEAVMDCVKEHRCVPRALIRTRFEGHIAHCCLAFELVFPKSRQIVREQGFLNLLLAESDADGKPLWTERELVQLRILKDEIGKALDEPAETK